MSFAVITYHETDRALAVRLWDELTWRGLSVWIDLNDTFPGVDADLAREDAISECDYLLAILTLASLNPIRRDLLLADDQHRTIIGLMAEPCPIPEMIISPIDFTDYDRGFASLIGQLPHHLFDVSVDINRALDNLRSPDPDVRRLALFLAGREGLVEAKSRAVNLMLTDEEPDVRAAAAWALDQFSHPATIPALVDALADPVFDIRSNAGWALVRMGEMAVEPTIAALRQGTKDARQMAYLVLVRIGGRAANDAIDRYWK